MSYIIDIKEMLKTKSRVFIFLKPNNTGHTTKISEAGKWSEPEISKILENKNYAYCNENNLKLLEKKEDQVIFNKLSRKYFQVV